MEIPAYKGDISSLYELPKKKKNKKKEYKKEKRNNDDNSRRANDKGNNDKSQSSVSPKLHPFEKMENLSRYINVQYA